MTLKNTLMSTDLQRGTDIHQIRVDPDARVEPHGENIQTLMRNSYHQGGDIDNRDDDEQSHIQNEMQNIPINRDQINIENQNINEIDANEEQTPNVEQLEQPENTEVSHQLVGGGNIGDAASGPQLDQPSGDEDEE